MARQTGEKPGTVEQAIKGRKPIHVAYARILEAAIALQDDALVGRLLAPAEAVKSGASLTEMAADLLTIDVHTDSTEDSPRLAYVRHPNASTRNDFLRHVRARIGLLCRLAAALEREQLEARAG